LVLVTLFRADDSSSSGTIRLGDGADNVRIDPRPAEGRCSDPCVSAIVMTQGRTVALATKQNAPRCANVAPCAARESGNAQFVERPMTHNIWTESQLSKYAFVMAPTLTTAYWLKKAADAWSQAETTQDQEARRIKLTIAEGYERLAKHAASLAAADQPEEQKLD
jgi:hypothetical protein